MRESVGRFVFPFQCKVPDNCSGFLTLGEMARNKIKGTNLL